MQRRVILVAALLIGGAAAFLVLWRWSDWRIEHSQDANILAAARRYGVDPALIKAVAWRESHFHPKARGRAGEIGLMQIMDAAAQEWADTVRAYPLPESHLLDPGTNTMAGAWYLRKLIQRYQHTDNPLPYALADYNAGRGNVLKWIEGEAATNSSTFISRIGFPSTRAYVLAVLDRREHYRRDFPPVPAPIR